MSEGKCTNCGQPSATDYCPGCEQFREQLERLRAAQRSFRRARADRRRKRMPGAGWFGQQTRRYAEQLQAERERAGELPLSGRAAALPPSDREYDDDDNPSSVTPNL